MAAVFFLSDLLGASRPSEPQKACQPLFSSISNKSNQIRDAEQFPVIL
jgi:hypothetical protein